MPKPYHRGQHRSQGNVATCCTPEALHWEALRRVERWSRKIHGPERFAWTMRVAEALLEGREPPPKPGRWMPGAAEDRIDTIRRLISGEAA